MPENTGETGVPERRYGFLLVSCLSRVLFRGNLKIFKFLLTKI